LLGFWAVTVTEIGALANDDAGAPMPKCREHSFSTSVWLYVVPETNPDAQNTEGVTAETANSSWFAELGFSDVPGEPHVNVCALEFHVPGMARVSSRPVLGTTCEKPTAQADDPDRSTPSRMLSPVPGPVSTWLVEPAPATRSQASPTAIEIPLTK
jgi:hypothetical protein